MDINQRNIRIDSALRAAVKVGALSSEEYDSACRLITDGEQFALLSASQPAATTPEDARNLVTLDRRDLWDYVRGAIHAALNDKIPKNCVVSWAWEEATNRTMDIFQNIVDTVASPVAPSAEPAAQICEQVAAQSNNHLFRSGAKICAGEIRRAAAPAQSEPVGWRLNWPNSSLGPDHWSAHFSSDPAYCKTMMHEYTSHGAIVELIYTAPQPAQTERAPAAALYRCTRCGEKINAGEKMACVHGPCPMELVDPTPDSHYEALEREHLGDPDKRTGIYQWRDTGPLETGDHA